jgi:hypothetical protein
MRVVNRLGALLLGLILLAVGVLTVIEAVSLAARHRSWPLPVQDWRNRLLVTPWSDRAVLIVSIIVGVIGLLILLSQLRPVRARHLTTTWNDPDDTWILSRRSIEQQATAAAESIRGVDSAHASTTGKPDRWQLDVTTRTVGDVVDSAYVEEKVRAQMNALGVAEDRPVRVSVRRTKSPA